jgi:hypothetical protein
MKRTDLIRKLEETGARSFGTAESTIGTATQTPVCPNQCPATKK